MNSDSGRWRRSVFWRLAAVLIGAELAVGALAIGLGARFAYDRGVELAETSIRLRLDAMAEELERGVDWRGDGLQQLPERLRRDLAARFPDPIWVVDTEGAPITTIRPVDGVADDAERDDAERDDAERDDAERDDAELDNAVLDIAAPTIPDNASLLLDEGTVVVHRATRGDAGFAIAPVYDDAGFLAGGLIVTPIAASQARELAPVRAAFIRATIAVAALALLIALLLGGVFTWQMVRPIRRIADRVEAIGRGEYDARLARGGADEFDRLAGSVNKMAAEVSAGFERLRATDRIRRELVANVGHDLRTPLAAVLARLEEADRHLALNELDRAAVHLNAARSQGDYLHRLVDDLFEISLLESPTPPLRREPVPVAEMVQDVIGRHMQTCDATSITLQAILEPGLPTLYMDGVRLLRTLDNLLANACRHAQAGVWLTAKRDGDWVVITVRDDGPGLDEENLQRVFERYYRGTDARTRNHRGSGLGLAISLAIAKAHGGTLSATNHTDGGALFTLELPVAEAPTQNGPAD